jgi:hypothetical protein
MENIAAGVNPDIMPGLLPVHAYSYAIENAVGIEITNAVTV